MPEKPPVIAAAAMPLATAISSSTISTSSSVKPRGNATGRMRLFERDVAVDARATRLAILAQAHQVERLALARCLVGEGMVPGVVEFGGLGIGTEPTAGIALHECVERGRQRAGVLFVLLHFLGDGLHLRLGEVDLGAVAAAEDARGREGDDAADEHDDQDDFDEAETGLRLARGRGAERGFEGTWSG